MKSTKSSSKRVSSPTFRTVFVLALTQLKLTDEIVCKELKIAKGTLSRWKNGHSKPGQATQRAIFRWLRKKVL